MLPPGHDEHDDAQPRLAMGSRQRDAIAKEVKEWGLWQSELRNKTSEDEAASPIKV